ncbi:TPM domain-containing protein [uncultured Rothia sp.]|uniref:TPM domain-containing protein n=1 Tax=uncultured Rothia sp. TaxID=316088 RepID=UPI003218046A
MSESTVIAKHKLILVLFLVMGAFLSHLSFARAAESPTSADIPSAPKEGYIRDDVDFLTPADEQDINAVIDAANKNTDGVRVMVYIFSSSEVSNIADYAGEVSKAWNLGGEEGNGALLAVNVRNGDMRIYRGRNATLDNASTNEILQYVLLPKLSEGDFKSGIGDAVKSIYQKAGQAEKVQQEEKNQAYARQLHGMWWVLGALSLYLIGVATYRIRRRQKFYRYADAQIYDAVSKDPQLEVSDETRRAYRKYRAFYNHKPDEGILPYNSRLKSKTAESHEEYTQYADNFEEWLPLYRANPDLYTGEGNNPDGRFR